MNAKVVGACAALAAIVCFACARKEDVTRPDGVAADAVVVTGGQLGGWWQQCTASTAGQAVRCRIWNRGGLVLHDEEFLPYDGGTAPTADELKIEPNPKFRGGDRIFLVNGRILLPRSRFDGLKKFIDGIPGQAHKG